MKEHNKRWLISKMKTSGSKRERVLNGSYADERHLQKNIDYDNLPSHKSFKSTPKFYNGKIRYDLLVRFLRGKVGNDWDEIYSEILGRIPTKLLHYKKMIFWFVADNVGVRDGQLYNKKSQRDIWTGGPILTEVTTRFPSLPEFYQFYVNPDTNKLIRIEQKSVKRIPRIKK
jgi:hypothetical protein